MIDLFGHNYKEVGVGFWAEFSLGVDQTDRFVQCAEEMEFDIKHLGFKKLKKQ